MDESSDPQSSASALRNPKHRHISRSAAKRESVQLLGSIKDLQAHFARAGFVEHRPGAGAGLKGSGLNTLGEDDEMDGENRPPPVRDERRRERKTWKDVDLPRVDPSAARREAKGIVASIRATWGLPLTSSSSGSSSMVSSPTTMFYPEKESAAKDTRGAFVNTARSIRTIRTLALAISHVARPTDRRVSSSSQLLPRPSSKLRQSFSTPSRPAGMPRAVSLGVPERKSSLGVMQETPQDDIQADLRKAAIEVLACLRALEEILRYEEGYDGDVARPSRLTDSPIESTGTGSSSLGTDTAQTSLRPPSTEPGYDEYGDDEEEYNLNALALADAENEQHTRTWEERIIAEGRQYREFDNLGPITERQVHLKEALSRWIAVVERIFQVPKEGANDVEDWAKQELWYGKPRERIQNFLSSYLPLQIQLLMPSTADRDFSSTILSKLSDGFALIHAYNSVVLSSSKPWGFIPEEDIHDTVSRSAGLTPDGEGGQEWTFRRIGNLTSWAATLKHRYNLPISLPSTTTSSAFLPKVTALPPRAPGPSPDFNPSRSLLGVSSSTRPSREGQRIDFDPALVAKKGQDWEVMFESLLTRWVEEASNEAVDQLHGSATGL